jgi:hypothetical protein
MTSIPLMGYVSAEPSVEYAPLVLATPLFVRVVPLELAVLVPLLSPPQPPPLTGRKDI